MLEVIKEFEVGGRKYGLKAGMLFVGRLQSEYGTLDNFSEDGLFVGSSEEKKKAGELDREIQRLVGEKNEKLNKMSAALKKPANELENHEQLQELNQKIDELNSERRQISLEPNFLVLISKFRDCINEWVAYNKRLEASGSFVPNKEEEYMLETIDDETCGNIIGELGVVESVQMLTDIIKESMNIGEKTKKKVKSNGRATRARKKTTTKM